MTRDQRRLMKSATTALRRAIAAESGDERTRAYRATADLLVELRTHFTNSDGEPDMRGTSFPYRDAVRDIYAEAGLTSDPNDPVKAALRYHVGNALRERLSADELVAYGLAKANPRDRQRERHGSNDATDADIIASIAMMAARLGTDDGRISPHDIARATEASRVLSDWVAKHSKR